MDFLSFLLPIRGIGPRVRNILDVSALGADALASGGACFSRLVWSECVGVEVGGLSLSGLAFFLERDQVPFQRN